MQDRKQGKLGQTVLFQRIEGTYMTENVPMEVPSRQCRLGCFPRQSQDRVCRYRHRCWDQGWVCWDDLESHFGSGDLARTRRLVAEGAVAAAAEAVGEDSIEAVGGR
jgi:hypothetical protein